MKHYYVLFVFLFSGFVYAQTTITYPQRVANYSAFFTSNGGNFNQGTDQFGMWANGSSPKQSVAWRRFTQDGTTTGTPSTMAIGDSFTITVSATQSSFGVIGLALLSSPTSTLNWADRINNYAVQVNLNGNSGANDPWQVVSAGGTINPFTIKGSTAYADFKFKFTLNSATNMTVSINDGAESHSVTINNQNITGYSVYFEDDWNGASNANIYWKPVTEYRYISTLGTSDLSKNNSFSIYPNPVNNMFTINKNIKELKVYDITGKSIKTFEGDFEQGYYFDISTLPKSVYILKITNNFGVQGTTKLVKI